MKVQDDGGTPDQWQIQCYDWIRRISEGDEASLRAFYDATMSRVYTVALRITGNSSIAEEVVENVFFQVWRTAASFDLRRGSPLTWLFVMCRSHALSSLRKINKSNTHFDMAPQEEELGDENTDPQSLLIAIEENIDLHMALQSLNNLDRQLITLAFFHDMSYLEIATRMAMPLGTVKARIRRALQSLKIRLNVMKMRG